MVEQSEEGGDYGESSPIAIESIDLVVQSVVGLIKSGSISRNQPVEGWGVQKKGPQRETVDRLAQQRRYNRITKLLNKAEQGKLDTQTLAVLNADIDKKENSNAAPEDVILQDLSYLVKAKEERRRVREARKRAAAQQKKAADKARQREEELDKLQQEDDERRKAWEEEMMNRINEEKEARRQAIKEKKAAQKAQEAQAIKQAKQLREKIKKNQGANGPLHLKMEKQYEEKVKLPELERNQKYLASLKEQFHQPVKEAISEHKQKVGGSAVKKKKRVVVSKPVEVFRSKAYEQAIKEKKALTAEQERIERLKQQNNYAKQVKQQNLKKQQLYKEKGGILNSLVVPEAPAKLAAERRNKGNKQAVAAKDYLVAGKEQLAAKPVKRELTKVVKEKAPQAVKRTNYLADLHKDRKDAPVKANTQTKHQLQEAAAGLEAEAKKREVTLKADFSATSLEDAAEVSEMYVDVAKKKLELLQSGQDV